MDHKPLPPADLLRQLLDYDPATGSIMWKARTDVELFAQTSGRFSREAKARMWNGRFAGKSAFNRVTEWGHRCGKLLDEHYHAHRIIWKMIYGQDPPGIIDHINGDGSDNRIENLRVVDSIGNCRNSATARNNTSGCSGVYFRSTGRGIKRWVAMIGDGKRARFLGIFLTKEQAIHARKGAERELGYHPNHGRPCRRKP